MSKTNQTLSILTLLSSVLVLNPADQGGFIGAQQKVREIKDELDPDERAKFDEVLDKLLEARNATLPGRGFSSLTSGYVAPPAEPAPAVPDEPPAPAAPAQTNAEPAPAAETPVPETPETSTPPPATGG